MDSTIDVKMPSLRPLKLQRGLNIMTIKLGIEALCANNSRLNKSILLEKKNLIPVSLLGTEKSEDEFDIVMWTLTEVIRNERYILMCSTWRSDIKEWETDTHYVGNDGMTIH